MGRNIIKNRCGDYKRWAYMSISFGVGMCVSCFCPETFVLVMAALIIVALGIVIIKH